ncbi:hypothetical protein GCM10027265_17980 [Jatrophihabitans fulvus]
MSSLATTPTSGTPTSGGAACGPLGAIGTPRKLGQPFENGGFRVTVHRFASAKTLSGSGDATGTIPDARAENGKFVVVFMTIENVSPAPVSYTGDNELFDECARRYRESSEDQRDDDPADGGVSIVRYDDDLQPGESRTGYIAFDVPATVKPAFVFVQARSAGYDHQASDLTPVELR